VFDPRRTTTCLIVGPSTGAVQVAAVLGVGLMLFQRLSESGGGWGWDGAALSFLDARKTPRASPVTDVHMVEFVLVSGYGVGHLLLR
jgi:hypothetical protein